LHEGSAVRILSVADEIQEEGSETHRQAVGLAEREIRSARSDLVVESVLSRGRPASVIVEEARGMAADLVVVGHRGRSRWTSVLLGSVSAEVVDQAPCPVLVARGERLGPVVLADDGSSFARTAETVLTRWPMFEGLPITVVTVAEDGHPAAATRSDVAAERLRHAGLEAGHEVRDGDPALQIIATATELGAGLIIVGTRGHTGLRRLVLGSVARKVLLHAPCSVLVVRDGVGLAPSERDREVVGAFG